jgi:hypothetical protein
MCDAARSQVEYEEPLVEAMLSKLDQDNLDRLIAIGAPGERSFFHKELHDQAEPTQVVKMVLPDHLRDQMIREMRKVKEVEDKLLNISRTAAGLGYTPVSLEFDNAVIFQPSCIEFMQLNRDLVHRHFPEIHTCMCNAFMTDSKSPPYGLHQSTAIGYEFQWLFRRGWLYPEMHKSFHTAILPTNLTSSPFSIFDGVLPQVRNVHFLYHALTRISLSERETRLVKGVHTAFTQDLVPINNVRLITDYLYAKYMAFISCPPLFYGGNATYWNLEPGEALYFNNYRAHSDQGLGSFEHPRITMDLRCFSKIKLPWPFSHEEDFFRSLETNKALQLEAVTVCLLRLLNYTSQEDFFQTNFEKQFPAYLGYATGNVMTGVNGGEHSLLHESNLEGMRRHAARVQHAYETDSLNFEAFEKCYSQYSAVVSKDPKGVDSEAFYGIGTAYSFGARILMKVKSVAFFVRVYLGSENNEKIAVAFSAIALCALIRVGAKPGGKHLNSS